MRNRKLNCSFVQDNKTSGRERFTRQEFLAEEYPGKNEHFPIVNLVVALPELLSYAKAS